MKLFVCIYDDARLLCHFLRHYTMHGVTEFHIAAPPDLSSYVDRFSDAYRIRQYNDFDVHDSFMSGTSAVTNMRAISQDPDEWVVIVDLDEFVEFDEPLLRLTTKAEEEGANVVRGIMIDRFALDGQLKAFDETSRLPELYPVRARFIKHVMRGEDVKCVLVKGQLKSRMAHHKFHDERACSRTLEISHYKWNDRAIDRVRAAYDLQLARNGCFGEYKTVLNHYEAHGRFAWETFGGEVEK